MAKRIKGMSMCNPVDLERDYLIYTAEYAIKKGYTHFEMIGPTHHPIKGNIDGMMYYRKYSQFNKTKDHAYVEYCEKLVNEVCDMLAPHGIKTYYWHHELEIPYEFDEEYPEIHNIDGDVEVTHPLIKDFLENKILDFFHMYPKMDGIVLTLHETRIPLLKLKNQKLGKIERVKYVTEILYNACKKLGKELIVRPFASMAADYDDFIAAYEQISPELIVCDKWTQFDWSLTMPHNEFFNKIKKNPLMVETDIFGEYFGKGFLPLMLKDHIISKHAYCEGFEPRGYVSRIDRGGFIPFGTPNEVNLEIMNAVEDGRDVDEAIDAFFAEKYGECGPEVRALMEDTEEIQIMMFYIDKVEFSMLSVFPSLSYLKTAQKVEMLRDERDLDETAWYIPKNFVRPPLEELMAVKRDAVVRSEKKLADLEALRGRLPENVFYSLYMRFWNLYYAARLWEQLTFVCIGLAMFFERKDVSYEEMVRAAFEELKKIDSEGKERLGEEYYANALGKKSDDNPPKNVVLRFIDDITKAFDLELEKLKELEAKKLVDYVIAGGFSERHGLRKEINFSSSHTFDDGVCRLAGSSRGKAWSVVKAHGWFSYNVNVKPNAENLFTIVAKGSDGHLDLSVDIDGEKTVIRECAEGKVEFTVRYTENKGKDKVVIRFDRVSEHSPYVYTIEVR